ncbi:Arabidopsis protein of unknown function (DUF241 [Striga hermonthica]|uniref:DUF241 domain protein n=1 Tax=Striga hermonthica TaxID=68872 RepID=A0A9N7R936_STRHE|nr:Arabidopsis protein of unknown function (DUF241 [Striga hermonthica]
MIISTPLRSKILSRARSSTLPSKSHPLIPLFDVHFNALKSNLDSVSSTSLPLIATQLQNLDKLYDCVDDLLLLPHTSLLFARVDKRAGKILDGYLNLVDICATTKDLLSLSKECISSLTFALRRKRDSANNLFEFVITSRNSIKKKIRTLLKKFGTFKNKSSVSAQGKDLQETIAIISMLEKTELITLELFESLLSSVAGVKRHYSRPSDWLLVSKLVKSRKKPDEQYFKSMNLEFRDFDDALRKVVGYRVSKCESSEIEGLQMKLREMGLIVHVIEERFESLFKRLIKFRVSLLNIHSQHSS